MSKTAQPSRMDRDQAPVEEGGLDRFISDMEPFFYRRKLTFVDVGAFEGHVFQQLLNSRISIGEAHLIEPNPKSFEKLREVVQGRFPRVALTLHNVAVGAQTGHVRMREARTMTKVLGPVSGEDELSDDVAGTSVFVVKSVTLDMVADACTDRRIDLLKVDVEGAEADVLLGASDLLSDQRVDVLYLEAGANPEGTQQCYYRTIDDILTRFGYRLFRIYEQKHEWKADSPFLRRMNLAYFSSRFADARPYRVTRELFDESRRRRQLQHRVDQLSRQRDEQDARLKELQDEVSALHARLDVTRQQLVGQKSRNGELTTLVQSLEGRLRDASTRIREVRGKAQALQQSRKSLLQSRSWKITAPLRLLTRYARRLSPRSWGNTR